jgi:hypothetical protein
VRPKEKLAMASTTHPVRVRIREITYASKTTDVLDRPVIVYSTAYGPGRPEIEPSARLGMDIDPESEEYSEAVKDFKLGQLVELLDDDYVRLRNGNAVVDAEVADQMAVADEDALDVNTASIGELAEWIANEQPNVNETVQASGGEPALAKKLLEAETEAHDGDPRKGVVDGLTAVIARN